MINPIAIKVDNVSKTFDLPHEKVTSIKGAVVNFHKRNRSIEKQHVLHEISFEIKKGEFFGIVGRNGSGKSTLLKLLAGIYTPDTGNITVNGKLTPFIELGVGFNPELTGRENVFLNGALLGFNRSEMSQMYSEIVAFAELDRFMDQKLKNYSSGMQVRLAFSIAIRAKSDILLIDEVLAVGDAAFQTKCFDYFQELRKSNTTVIFVSHDRASLERFCQRGVLINDGKIIQAGTIQKVMKSYSAIVMEELEGPSVVEQNSDIINKPLTVSISEVKTLDEDGRKATKFDYLDVITVQFTINIKETVENPIIGVTVWCRNVDKAIYAVNTLIDGIAKTGTFTAGSTLTFAVRLPNMLNDGEYYIEPAVANESATVFYDQQPRAGTFYIAGSPNPHSILSSDNKINLTINQRSK